MKIARMPSELRIVVEDVTFVFRRPVRADFLLLDKSRVEQFSEIAKSLTAIEGELVLDGEAITVEKFRELDPDALPGKVRIEIATHWVAAFLNAHGFQAKVSAAEEKKDQGS